MRRGGLRSVISGLKGKTAFALGLTLHNLINRLGLPNNSELCFQFTMTKSTRIHADESTPGVPIACQSRFRFKNASASYRNYWRSRHSFACCGVN